MKIKVLENEFQTEVVAKDIYIKGQLVTANLHLGRLFFACKIY